MPGFHLGGGGGGVGGQVRHLPPFGEELPHLGFSLTYGAFIIILKIHKLDRNKHYRILNRYFSIFFCSIHWCVGVKCLISIRKLVISIMSLQNQEWPENVSEAFSEHLKFKNFLGGACPQTPLDGALLRTFPCPSPHLNKVPFCPLCPFSE